MAQRLIVAVLLLAACDPTRPLYQGPTGPECPAVIDSSTPYFADVSCSARACRVVAEQSACTVSIDLLDCDVDGIVATVDREGAWAVTRETTLEACRPLDGDGDDVQLDCRRSGAPCSVSLRAVRDGPPLDVRRIPILDVMFEAPSGSTLEPLDYRDPIIGYLGGAAMLGTAIVVSSYGDDFRSTRCPSPQTTSLAFVDRDTLEVTTSSAPDCLTLLVDDPTTDGFLGLHDDGLPRISRFDVTGRVIETATVRVTVDANGSRPSALYADASGVYAAYNHLDAHLARLDPVSLETSTVAVVSSGMFRDITRVGSDLVVTERVVGLLLTMDPVTLETRDATPLAHALRPSNDAGAVFHSGESNRLYVSATGTAPVLWSYDEPLGAEAPSFLVEAQRRATIWGMTSSPLDDDVWAFGVGPSPEYETVLLEIDERERRWRPRTTTLGRGVVRSAYEDGVIRWAFNPWSAELLRIRAVD